MYNIFHRPAVSNMANRNLRHSLSRQKVPTIWRNYDDNQGTQTSDLFHTFCICSLFLAKHLIAFSIWAFSFLGFPCATLLLHVFVPLVSCGSVRPNTTCSVSRMAARRSRKKIGPSPFLINYPIGAFTVQNVRYVESEEREDKETGEGELAVKEWTPICMNVV